MDQPYKKKKLDQKPCAVDEYILTDKLKLVRKKREKNKKKVQVLAQRLGS